MQRAEVEQGDDLACGGRLNSPFLGCILLQRQVVPTE